MLQNTDMGGKGMNNNRGLLATGIILLCVGIVLFFVGYNVVSEITAYDVEGIPISEWLMGLSPSLRQQYETGQSYMQYGSILVIIGLISCVLFIILSRKKLEEDSMKILKSRYAKGEITKEEFEQMKKVLE